MSLRAIQHVSALLKSVLLVRGPVRVAQRPGANRCQVCKVTSRLQEGWEPSTYKSSRDSRAAGAQQQAVDFMDDDERAELEAKGLQATNPYDTFAANATAEAQGKAEAEAARRHGQAAASLNLFPTEALKASHVSIGMSLLQKMGWRPVRILRAALCAACVAMGSCAYRHAHLDQALGTTY